MPLITAVERQKQGDQYGFEASLVYTERFRTIYLLLKNSNNE